MTTWYVELNPAASEQLGHLLASFGEIGGSESSRLVIAGVPHSCWIIPPNLINKIKESVHDYPDVFRKVHFFKKDAPGRKPERADFLTGKRIPSNAQLLVKKAVALKAQKTAQS